MFFYVFYSHIHVFYNYAGKYNEVDYSGLASYVSTGWDVGPIFLTRPTQLDPRVKSPNPTRPDPELT